MCKNTEPSRGVLLLKTGAHGLLLKIIGEKWEISTESRKISNKLK